MKKFLIIVVLTLLPTVAFAQSQRNPCYINSNGGCTPVSTANPMPVTNGSGTSTVSIDQTTPGTTNGVVINSQPGAANFTTAQVSITTSNTVAVASRATRRSVTITNITGTQPIYCSGTTATTANGQYIPAVPGANFTASTAAAINCITVTSAQTISVAEIY